MTLTPLACAAVIFAGSRIAVPRPVHAASVEARALGGDGRALSLSVLTYLDDSGVREAAALESVRVTAESASGSRSEWMGRCDDEGICEARLTFDAAPTSPVRVRVEHAGDDAPLAEGSFDLSALEGPTTSAPAPWARSAGRSGALVVDVAALDATVAPEVAVPIVVRVQREGHGLAGAAVTIEPGGGSEILGAVEATCAEGLATAQLLVRGPIAELRVTATAGEARGEWFGALPVTPGASHVAIARGLGAGATARGDVLVPSPRGSAYVELWDERGAVLATRVVAQPASGAVPSAALELPGLAVGPHWLVTAARPRGALALEGATRSQPLLVTRTPLDRCALTAALVGARAVAFPRSAPLDGIAVRRRGDAARARLGRAMALSAIAVGGVLELVLLVFGVRRSQRDLAALEEELDASSAEAPLARWVSVTIAVLLTALGFLLLAALVAYKGS